MPGINLSPWAVNAARPAVNPRVACPLNWATRANAPMADVAIVILNYNGRRYLDDCLASLRRLRTPWEPAVAGETADDPLSKFSAAHPNLRARAFRQTATPVEIVVADNGSTDDSLGHLREHHS